MNGAESLIRTLLAGGVDVCFTNPGTSEIHIVAALDQIAEMRCVLGPVRRRRHGRSRRIRPHGRETGKHAAPSRSRTRQRPSESAQCQPGAGTDRQPGGPACDVSSAIRHAPHLGHRRHCAAVFQVAAHLSLLFRHWPRRGGSGRCCSYGARPDRHADRPRRCLLERGAVRSQASPRCLSLLCPTLRPSSARPRCSGQACEPRSCSRECTVRQRTGCCRAHRRGHGRQAARSLSFHSHATRGGNSQGRPRSIRPRTRNRAVQGIPSADSGGRSGSSRVFRLSREKTVCSLRRIAEIHTLASPGEDYVGALDALAEALSVRETDLPAEKAERPPMPSGEITLRDWLRQLERSCPKTPSWSTSP